MKKATFPFTIKRGSVIVKIYSTPSHGSDSFTLSYYQDGVRKRPTFPDFDKAKTEAELVAGRLCSSDSDVLTLTSADRSAYLRARQLLDPLGIPIEAAAAQFVEAKKLLGDSPLSHAVEFYVKRHPTKIPPRAASDVMEEMLAWISTEPNSPNTEAVGVASATGVGGQAQVPPWPPRNRDGSIA